MRIRLHTANENGKVKKVGQLILEVGQLISKGGQLIYKNKAKKRKVSALTFL